MKKTALHVTSIVFLLIYLFILLLITWTILTSKTKNIPHFHQFKAYNSWQSESPKDFSVENSREKSGVILFLLFIVGLFFIIKVRESKRINLKSLAPGNHTIKFNGYKIPVKVRDITKDEYYKKLYENANNPDCYLSDIILPKTSEGAMYHIDMFLPELEDKDYLLSLENTKKIIEEEISFSQKNSCQNKKMIPMCVPFEDRLEVKRLGAQWCPENRSWFWSFDKDRSSVEKWLPLVYKNKRPSAYILPMMIPKNLWGINLRSLLPQEHWDKIRKDTYKRFSYRCFVCGCKGQSWPVECDERWRYIRQNSSSSYGTVIFDGVMALCPSCHGVKHFGKSLVDGRQELAIARLCFLNKWHIVMVDQLIESAFRLWAEESKMGWNIDFSFLKRNYGIELSVNPVSPLLKL